MTDLPDFISDSDVSSFLSKGADSAAPNTRLPDFIPDSEVSSYLPKPSEPSIRDYALGALKGVAKAGTDVVAAPADLLFKGSMALADKVHGTETDLTGFYPSDYRDQFLEYISDEQGEPTTENAAKVIGNVATLVSLPSKASAIAKNLPVVSKVAQAGQKAVDAGGKMTKAQRASGALSKAVGRGVEGGAQTAALAAREDDFEGQVATGAAADILLPPALRLAGRTLGKTAKGTKEAARKMNLKAFGSNKTRIRKAYEMSPNTLDELGEAENPISQAIESFKKSGGGTKGMGGQTLLDDLAKQSQQYVDELHVKLSEATAKQDLPVEASFNFTKEYVETLPGAVKAEARVMAEELIAKTSSNMDGTLISMQKEKVGLNKVIRDSAYGSDANPIKTNILKRIKADLRQGIEDNYAKITGESGDDIATLNKELGHRETLRELFTDIRNSDEARDIFGSLIQSLRTSGGVGQVVVAGTAAKLGVPIAALPVLLNMYIQTPTGRRQAASVLGSEGLQKLLTTTAEGSMLLADPAGKATIGVIAGGGSENADTDKGALASPQSSTRRGFMSSPSSGPSGALSGKKKGNSMKKSVKAVEAQIDQDPVDAAIYATESNRDPLAKNKNSSASGGFQLIKQTAKSLGVKDVFDLEQNYNGYRKLRAEHEARFGNDPEAIYAAHFLGATLMSKWLRGAQLTKDERAIVKSLETKAMPRFRKKFAEELAKRESVEI